jgi:hypothetical protein
LWIFTTGLPLWKTMRLRTLQGLRAMIEANIAKLPELLRKP